jgi:hypothetical protein
MKSNRKYSPSFKKVNLGATIVAVGSDLKPKLNAPLLLQYFLKTHAKVGDECTLVLTVKRPKRSERQNNYFFLYLSLIALSCGHSVDELHQWVKSSLLAEGITEIYGDKVVRTGNTSLLNVSEFSELIERIHEKTGIPPPDASVFNLPLTHSEHDRLKEVQKRKYAGYKNDLPKKP